MEQSGTSRSIWSGLTILRYGTGPYSTTFMSEAILGNFGSISRGPMIETALTTTPLISTANNEDDFYEAKNMLQVLGSSTVGTSNEAIESLQAAPTAIVEYLSGSDAVQQHPAATADLMNSIGAIQVQQHIPRIVQSQLSGADLPQQQSPISTARDVPVAANEPQQSILVNMFPSHHMPIDEQQDQHSIAMLGEADRQVSEAAAEPHPSSVLLSSVPDPVPGLVPSESINNTVSSLAYIEEGVTSVSVDRTQNNNLAPNGFPIKAKLSNLPTAERHGTVGFVGRVEYLNTLSLALVPDDTNTHSTSPAAFAIIGVAGQGKTQTALRFALQQKELFSYIIWVHADHEHKLVQDLQEFALSLGLITEPSSNPWSDATMLREWLENLDRRFLIIFDNAEDPSLLRKVWPRNRQGSILITARNPEFKTPNVTGNGQYLEDLEPDEALEMLQSGLPQFRWTRTEKREASSLLKLIGCHPFGILVIISQINSAGCSLERYRADYSLDNIFTDSTYGNNLTGSYDKRLAELWSLTVERLDSRPKALIEMFALLDVDAFQETLLQVSKSTQGVSNFIDLPIRCLKTLTNAGLIYATETDVAAETVTGEFSESRSFHMHRLTQASVLLGLTPESRFAAFRSATVLLLLAISSSEAAQSEYRALNRQYRDFYKHANALHAAFQEQTLPCIPFQFVELLCKMSRLCYKKDMASAGLQLCETGVKITKDSRLQGPFSHADIGHVSIELNYSHACIATELGDFQTSLDKFQAALDVFKQIENERGPQTPQMQAHWKTREQSLYGGIANSLDGLGEHEEAEIKYRQCLDIETEDDEFSPYEVNICRCMLFENKVEKTEEAAELLLDFLQRYTEKYGQDESRDYLPGHACYWLGNIRVRQGRLADARKLHAAAVRIFEATFGSSHHKTGDAHHKLGWHLARAQQYDVSIEELRKALHIYAGGQGKPHRRREIARTRFKLGLVYFQNGEDVDGEKQLEKARELRKEILGHAFFESEEEKDYDELVSKWAR